MHRNMLQSAVCSALVTGLAAALTACGGGGGSSSANPPQGISQVALPLTLSDASSDDWATIGVKRAQHRAGAPGRRRQRDRVDRAQPAPCVNLEQLDQLGEILGNVSVPPGTYTGAVLTVSANPGDVLLTVAENPAERLPGRWRHQHSRRSDPDPGKAGRSGNSPCR